MMIEMNSFWEISGTHSVEHMVFSSIFFGLQYFLC